MHDPEGYDSDLNHLPTDAGNKFALGRYGAAA